MINNYMDESYFDVYAYNCYNNTEAQTVTMGYREYQRTLQPKWQRKSFICTGFGYSVSHKGFGRYGGQTLTQQSDGLIANYRDLIGAVVMCSFYYKDGWCKDGNQNYYNPEQSKGCFESWVNVIRMIDTVPHVRCDLPYGII